MAFLISIALNVILVTVDFSMDPRRAELSRMQRWAVHLLSPCGSIENAICMGTWRNADSGSVLLYAITAWVILSLPACWRHRA